MYHIDIDTVTRYRYCHLKVIGAVPLDVAGSRQHIVSLRHGVLVDKARLFALMAGDPLHPLPPPGPPAAETGVAAGSSLDS